MFSRHQISKIRTECIIQKSHCVHGENRECWEKHIFKTPRSQNYEQNALIQSVTASMVKIKSVGQYGNKYPGESLG